MSGPNIEFEEKSAAALENATSATRKRLVLDTDGTFKTKSDTGVIAPLAGVIVRVHNAVVVFGASPYAASINETVKVDPSGGAITIDLPTAAGLAGQLIRVKNVTTVVTPITVDAFGSETIDGSLTFVMSSPGEDLAVESDGVNWMIMGG